MCICLECNKTVYVRKDAISGKSNCGCIVKLHSNVGITDIKMQSVNDKKIRTIWEGMLSRCYNKNTKSINITYEDASVCDEWKYLSSFYDWAYPRRIDGLFLDKDLKVLGNKVYSPNTCLFVTREVNNFLTLHSNDRGLYPLGVSWHTRDSVFQGSISICGKRLCKYFTSSKEAHLFWQQHKAICARELASRQIDVEVQQALIRIAIQIEGEIRDGKETTFKY